MSTSNLGQALQQAIGQQSQNKQLQMLTIELEKRFPVIKDNRPLSIGIYESLVAALPHFTPAVIKRALQSHCSRIRYQKQLARGGKRFNLQGKPDGAVTEEEQQFARQLIEAKAKPEGVKPESTKPEAA